MENHPESAQAAQTSDYTAPSRPPPRSSSEHAAVRVRNRRREYLERNPAYFDSAEHELAGESLSLLEAVRLAANRTADPVLYDKLVRQFQTPAEKDADDTAKGYGHVVEAALRRGEATTGLAAQAVARSTGGSQHGDGMSLPGEGRGQVPRLEAEWADLSTPPSNRAEAADQWREYLRARFVRGGDTDFDYATVDEDEDYDTLARRDAEDAWFEDEDPEWVSTEAFEEARQDTERQSQSRPQLQGETGVQDF